MASVTTEKQRSQFLTQLTAAEDWLYEDGENAPAADHKYALHFHAVAQLCHSSAKMPAQLCHSSAKMPKSTVVPPAGLGNASTGCSAKTSAIGAAPSMHKCV